MSDWNDENQGPTEDAPNPTQQAIDEEGPSGDPVDVGGWDETEDSPHEGEEGQAGDVA
jgi:hypothetical protein